MTQDPTLCPSSDTGNHRYFIFKTFETYEPVLNTPIINDNPQWGRELYEKKEYATLGCNCGSVVKQMIGRL